MTANDPQSHIDGGLRTVMGTISHRIHVDKVEIRAPGHIQVWTQAYGEPRLFSAGESTNEEAVAAILAEARAFVTERENSLMS